MYSRRDTKTFNNIKMINMITSEEIKRSASARTCKYACARAHTHTHTHTHFQWVRICERSVVRTASNQKDDDDDDDDDLLMTMT